MEVRDSHESPRITVNFVESDTVNVSVTKLKGGFNTRLESEKENNENQKAFSYLDMPAATDSDGSSESIFTSDNSNVDLTLVADLESFSRSKTLSRSVRKTGFFSWKRRRLSFKSFGSLRVCLSLPLSLSFVFFLGKGHNFFFENFKGHNCTLHVKLNICRTHLILYLT